MYKHILIPVDGSPLAEQALPHAEEIALAAGAEITVISCVEPYVITLPTMPGPVPSYTIDTDVDALAEERKEYLEAIQEY